ncbi:hypothetical protein C1I95_25730 [Micromonospora craterilacus]|uniref:Uncharacterized protein n=1 Tax=Micromonospora craterilacus TaxID=1655439 RepID=A0A2W2DKJ1_9ACTN|nr:hypothetical protein [Micromonospora craterilacus]PZG12452.1 hypothetical protein C1I95_25730 [Micromonospora craterilacus]
MSTEPVGYIVLIREHDRWCDNWDAEVHTDQTAGGEALTGARAAGYEAILVAAVPVDAAPIETPEQSAAIVDANLRQMGCAGLVPSAEAGR